MLPNLVTLSFLLALPSLIQCYCPRVITKSVWDASPPKSPPVYLIGQPQYVILYSTLTPNCLTENECKERVRSIQTYHQNTNGWSDIGYNFLVGGDGNIYEGRGWGIEGSHSTKYNKNSVAIAVIRNSKGGILSRIQENAINRLIKCGLDIGGIKRGYKLINSY